MALGVVSSEELRPSPCSLLSNHMQVKTIGLTTCIVKQMFTSPKPFTAWALRTSRDTQNFVLIAAPDRTATYTFMQAWRQPLQSARSSVTWNPSGTLLPFLGYWVLQYNIPTGKKGMLIVIRSLGYQGYLGLAAGGAPSGFVALFLGVLACDFLGRICGYAGAGGGLGHH